jgi:hypothetical protein
MSFLKYTQIGLEKQNIKAKLRNHSESIKNKVHSKLLIKNILSVI